MLISQDVIKNSGIQFGTSGARGLVEDFTPEVCAAFTSAFLSCMKAQFLFSKVAIAMDNRPSSPQIAKACISAIENLGLEAVYYGILPTPALAYSAMQERIPCIMVTGSHIPFDRNGLKFYRPDGEISKTDEQAILLERVSFQLPSLENQLVAVDDAKLKYIQRYTSLFDSNILKGIKVGVYEHSSSGRDIYASLFEALGAEVTSLGRTDTFVPIDTEAVTEADCIKALRWISEHNLDFIFSTDGDGDRPLVTDEKGNWLRGDILGLVCAHALNAEAVVVPISCNTAIEKAGFFKNVVTTQIGSPYVISEFSRLTELYESVVGFEANGGFLLGSDIKLNGRLLKALPTRDAVLPALMLLNLSKKAKITSVLDDLPKRFTHSDRIQNFDIEKSRKLVDIGKLAPSKLLKYIGLEDVSVEMLDLTDGLRLTFSNEDVLHIRPSGNAPELRCYVESNDAYKAKYLVEFVLESIVKLDLSNL
ncbi:phosphomannomutase [Vibrio parahaemolyticus]|nr:phosphomannomutase [Vibrio parahaemolyticus]KYX99510.1 phosphomannomutase [Vibrio parahaemolyticus]ODY29668.1 phosphomannomutase [Vibrio parahaemolyticus]ODY92352.1 phosphomannomutase [Vibrio parahaemolyticus]ODZ03821.1 phosphomannomutase [Vibrio parahaemolyticus]OEB64643.1 phosphomannomutase [Vibrio parahaemolyticus]